MIPANMSTTPLICAQCGKTVNHPTVTQKYCNAVCRDRHNHPRSQKREWFKAKKKHQAMAKQTHSIKGVNFGSNNIVGANKMGAFDPEDVIEIWHEPDSWPVRTSVGKPICPRCGAFLRKNEVQYCHWCVKDRARFMEMQNEK